MRKDPSTISALLAVALAATLILLTIVACSAAQQKADVVLSQDLTDATCTELEASQQTDTAFVQFVCNLVDPKTGQVKTFRARMYSADMARFACGRATSSPSAAPAP